MCSACRSRRAPPIRRTTFAASRSTSQCRPSTTRKTAFFCHAMVQIAAAQLLHDHVHHQRIVVDVHDPRDVLAVDPVFHRTQHQQLLTKHRFIDVLAVDHFDGEDLAGGDLLTQVDNTVAAFPERVQDAEGVVDRPTRIWFGGVDTTVQSDYEGKEANPLVLRVVTEIRQDYALLRTVGFHDVETLGLARNDRKSVWMVGDILYHHFTIGGNFARSAGYLEIIHLDVIDNPKQKTSK